MPFPSYDILVLEWGKRLVRHHDRGLHDIYRQYLFPFPVDNCVSNGTTPQLLSSTDKEIKQTRQVVEKLTRLVLGTGTLTGIVLSPWRY